MTTEANAPEPDELEISILGPGKGESIVVHVGDGDWIVVDSCLDKAGQAAALQYLTSIGVDFATSVKRIVATHWHDDHIGGISSLLEACKSADFCCSVAFKKDHFIHFITKHSEIDPSTLVSSTKEIVGCLSILRDRSRPPVFVKSDCVIYKARDVAIYALSPGNEKIEKFFGAIAKDMPVIKTTRTRATDLCPNEVAVAMLVECGKDALLLGADLEEDGGANGWSTIISFSPFAATKSSVFKVPHHGSDNAHHDPVWASMLDPNPWALITPYNAGVKPRPSPEDVERILGRTDRAYCTSHFKADSAPPVDKGVEKYAKQLGYKFRSDDPKMGQIRLRKKNGDADWGVKLLGPAVHLRNVRK